jgi:poly(3-hydroxyalkanoate) synthetase
VSCPIFFGICENDSVARAKATARHVRGADRAEVVYYRAGHFGVYVAQAFELIVTDQLAFLARYVPAD